MDSEQLERCNRNLLMGLLVAVSPWGIEAIYAGDTFAAVDVSQVKVEGEIGRRIDATLHKNVLVLDIDHAFLKPTRRALDFLIDRDGLVITGSCTSNECWHDSQNGTGNLADTCATAYLIRTLDELLRTDDYDSCWCCHSSSLRSAPGAVKPVMVLPPNHRTINVEQWSIEHSLKN